MSAYLITGASGVVGSEVTRLLLARVDAPVRVLLRADSPGALQARRRALVDAWDLPSSATARLEAVAGDIGQPRLGLAGEAFERVAADTARIVHCAGRVRMNLPLAEARAAALTAAEGVADLARWATRAGVLEKVEYVSTVGVRGRGPEPLPEDWVEGPREYHNTYEAAKAEAEGFVRRCVEDEGLPITVHRPSMVVGRSDNGEISGFQVFYHLCEFLSGRRTLGLYPPLGGVSLDLVPVDYVAAALTWSSAQPATAGRVLHLSSGPEQAVALGALRERVRAHWRAAGARLPPAIPVPVHVFRAVLPALRRLTPARMSRALGALPALLDYLDDSGGFANSRTRRVLGAAGVALPSPSEYLDPVLAFYARRQFGERGGGRQSALARTPHGRRT